MGPFIINDAPYEAGLKHLARELSEITIRPQSAEVIFGGNTRQQTLYHIATTFSKAGDIVQVVVGRSRHARSVTLND